MCRTAGHLHVDIGVAVKNPETMELGDTVFIGSQTMIQGRFDGIRRIGNHVWIGPHSYFDARNLVLEDCVGWGSGAKVLGSYHTGELIDVPSSPQSSALSPS
jgi:bifunctional N-acetylglucosamine-1-phosphate-uridyltransferase/glucosamine-1-phosphate-acetyltransferase GlmU-like protein